jgi:hypothetical protein
VSTQGRRIAALAVVSGGSHRATGACEWLAGRAGCLNWARPDPWEPWVGNRPGRPGKVTWVQHRVATTSEKAARKPPYPSFRLTSSAVSEGGQHRLFNPGRVSGLPVGRFDSGSTGGKTRSERSRDATEPRKCGRVGALLPHSERVLAFQQGFSRPSTARPPTSGSGKCRSQAATPWKISPSDGKVARTRPEMP